MQNSFHAPDNQRSLSAGDVVDGHRFQPFFPEPHEETLRDFAPLGVRDGEANRARRAALMSQLPDRQDAGFVQAWPLDDETFHNLDDNQSSTAFQWVVVGAMYAALVGLALWAVLSHA